MNTENGFSKIIARALNETDYHRNEDNQRLKAAVSDLAVAYPQERKMFIRDADDSFLRICSDTLLMNPEQIDTVKNKASQYIQHEYQMVPEVADTFAGACVDAFADYYHTIGRIDRPCSSVRATPGSVKTEVRVTPSTVKTAPGPKNIYYEKPVQATNQTGTPYAAPQTTQGVSAKKDSSRVLLIAGSILVILVIVGVAIWKGTQNPERYADNNVEETSDQYSDTEGEADYDHDEDESPEDDYEEDYEDESSIYDDYSEISMIDVIKATASDHLNEPEYGINHKAKCVIDDDLSTAWAVRDMDQGVGASVTLIFDDTYIVSGFTVWAGHQESQSLYEKNTRPAVIVVSFSDETVDYEYTLEDTMDGQSFEFDGPIPTGEVTFTITDVYTGYKYPYDLCISEISLF